MLKHYAHYRKHLRPDAKEFKAPASTVAKRVFVEELHEMEKRAVLEGFEFGGAPVMYRAQ